MNGWIILSIVASIAVVLMCVAILLGRGDWLVYELKSEDRQKYNIVRLRVVTSVAYLLLLLIVWMQHIFDFDDYISFAAVLLIAIITGRLKGGWAMRKS